MIWFTSNLLEKASWIHLKYLISLQIAIQNLPEKQRLVFNMRYYDEMSYQDIAEITETSEGALKASYHHAVKKIEEFLKSNVE
jgi:RNA polymerase sigma factor (sigma-70 family)